MFLWTVKLQHRLQGWPQTSERPMPFTCLSGCNATWADMHAPPATYETKFMTDVSPTRMLPVPKKYGLDQVTTRDSRCRYTGTPELWNVMIHPSGSGSVGGRPRPAQKTRTPCNHLKTLVTE